MRRRWWTGALVAVGAVLAAAAGPTGAAEAATQAPVATPAPASPLPGLDAAFDPSPPGSNNWHCRPSSAHPEPVVLVHGLTANQAANWGYLAPLLARHGYCVYSLTYGRNPLAPPPLSQVGGLVRMEQSSRELSRFVDRVLDSTGARKVDIVGHSEGSLMPDYYVKFLGGDRKVKRYVGMTPLWDGSRLYGVADLDHLAREYGLGGVEGAALAPLCASCREFLHGSAFLAKMHSGGGPAVPGVTYTMIMTTHDELVDPYTSGYLRGRDGAPVTNIVLQQHCPADLSEHAAVAFDPVAAQYITNALDPDHSRPVHCMPTRQDAPTFR
jgi:triacylglycerol lipase